jgi:carbon-monoxide dehydrogenase large subunit
MTIPGASFLAARTRSAPQGFGRPIPRKEDARLVTGRGRFSDDFNLPGQAHAHLVRSTHAHARVLSIDASAALAMPGVLAVLTARDALADGLVSIPHKPVPTNPNEFPLGGRDGARVHVTPHSPLATDTVRFAGEAVAMVIAETAAAAEDAAEAVRVVYEPLPSVTATPRAGEPGAPVLWLELGSNVCVDSVAGDARAADAAFASAAHTVRLDTWVPRITCVPMEPRAALGVYDRATGRYTLYAGAGGPVAGLAGQSSRPVAEEVAELAQVAGKRGREWPRGR